MIAICSTGGAVVAVTVYDMIRPIPSPTQPHQLFRNTGPYGNVAGRNLVVMMMVVVVVL